MRSKKKKGRKEEEVRATEVQDSDIPLRVQQSVKPLTSTWVEESEKEGDKKWKNS